MLKVALLILVTAWLVTAQPRESSSTYTHKKLCQSGLREDNTNYIYCARQNLTHIPADLSAAFNIGSVSNVLYDELVLSDNLIARIDAHTFGPSLKVKKLYLDMNPLRSMHAQAFKSLRNYLEEIYFEQKVIEETHDQVKR